MNTITNTLTTVAQATADAFSSLASAFAQWIGNVLGVNDSNNITEPDYFPTLNFDVRYLQINPYVIVEIHFKDNSFIQARALVIPSKITKEIFIQLEQLPFPINKDDIKEIYFYAQCNYSKDICKSIFNNIERFHGFPNLEYKYPYIK